ncbi:MAG: 2OG-Fe(II) oxygenase [Myxococcales bacterium]|nr:2OG-Fe(II) oxygenase [Myxococcales bacterium]
MQIQPVDTAGREGHPLSMYELTAAELATQPEILADLFEARHTGVVVRGALPQAQALADRINDAGLADLWASPNRGMPGGELKVIGEAATPTFTKMQGPSVEQYGEAARTHRATMARVFGELEPTARINHLFSGLNGGRAAGPAQFDGHLPWSPYTVRALGPGQQIYSHHDLHYWLAVYQRLPQALDRTSLLSWFITVQAPTGGGELTVYGLWGSDPNPPMLPTRFLDTQALEARFGKHAFDLRAGDLVVFDSGRHVHRVTPVTGDRPRLTLGGFMTLDTARTRAAYWS